MRCKWCFRHDITENCKETPAFHNKSTWTPTQQESNPTCIENVFMPDRSQCFFAFTR